MFTRIKINTWGQNQTPKTFTKENFDRFDYISRLLSTSVISVLKRYCLKIKDKSQTARKYLKIACLTRDFYPEYTKSSKHNNKNTQTTQHKIGKIFE